MFEVSQLPVDISLLVAILNFIGHGTLFSHAGSVSRIRVVSIGMLQHFVLPFFTLYPLPGHKGLQYNI